MATWTFDPSHTHAEFSARHMMITTVRGRFSSISGTLEYDPQNPSAASVDVSIDAASLDTRFEQRDNHLRSPDFLDVANYPTITFKSTRLTVKNDDHATLYGGLTIRGVTREVPVEVERLGMVKDPWTGGQRVGFVGKTKINREDWGLTWNVALEQGGVLVGKEITINLDVEAIMVAEAAREAVAAV